MKGKRCRGSVLAILGAAARKPRAFLTLRIGNDWHWWNKPAAWDLWRSLEASVEPLSAGQRSMLDALRLAFEPHADKEAAATA